MTPLRIVAAVLIGVCAAGLLWVFVVEPYRDNLLERVTANSTDFALESESEAQASAIARQNLDALRRSAARPWSDVEIFVLIAANHRVLRQYPSAIAAYDRALVLQPTPYLYLNRGVAELSAGQPAAAHESFLRAVRFDPALASEVHDAEEAYRNLQRQR